MSNEDNMLRRLLSCTIANDYDGLDDFKLFARENPETAQRIVWSVLTSKEDPGRDDGSLCVVLLETLNEVAGQHAVEKLVLSAWIGLSDPLRRNILSAAGSTKAISTELGITLFNLPETKTEQRHLIVVGFASGDKRPDCEVWITDLATRIGSYPEPHRQQILNEFVNDIMRNFGSKRTG